MQAKVPRNKSAQVLPTPEFHSRNSSRLIPALAAIVSQSSPDTTRWKASQSVTIPAWVGVGVVMPLLLVVVVVAAAAVVVVAEGVTPITSTQTKSPKNKVVHSEPTAGFQAKN